MKKKIGYVNLDPSLLRWLSDRLKEAPLSASSAGDFAEALAQLAAGEVSSLMVEAEEGEEDGEILRTDDRIVCGDLTIYTRGRRVVRDGEEISLTPKEFDILCFLAKNRGEVFTREQIYRAVWDDAYLLDDSNVMAFIRKLRKKIERHPDAPEYILTVWGIGYKFNDNL